MQKSFFGSWQPDNDRDEFGKGIDSRSVVVGGEVKSISNETTFSKIYQILSHWKQNWKPYVLNFHRV